MTDPLTAAARLAEQLEDHAPVACQTRDQRWWFPDLGDPAAHRDAANHLCTAFPVTAACLDYALAADERYGIWGGTTPSERTTMRPQATAA